MSKLWVDRIETMAKRRIARTAQVEALPPQPERLNANLWHLNRRNWVHGRTPGLLSRSVGKDDPIKAALADSPRLQQIITNNFPQYSLEELLVSPILPSEIYEAVQFNMAIYDPSQPDAAMMSLYEPAGYNITTEVTIQSGIALDITSALQRFTGPAIPAPCILREIAYHPGEYVWTPSTFSMTMLLEGWGSVHSVTDAADEKAHAKGRTMAGINQWIIAGSLVPTIEFRFPDPVGTVTVGSSPYLFVTAEPLIRKA